MYILTSFISDLAPSRAPFFCSLILCIFVLSTFSASKIFQVNMYYTYHAFPCMICYCIVMCFSIPIKIICTVRRVCRCRFQGKEMSFNQRGPSKKLGWPQISFAIFVPSSCYLILVWWCSRENPGFWNRPPFFFLVGVEIVRTISVR